MAPLLEAKRLMVYRGATRVFEEFSLNLAQGQHTAILGPNGAGKSTLLRLLLGDVHPVPDDKSVLRLFGMDRWNVWELRAQIGFVSHDLQRDYLPDSTGLDVLLSGYHASIGVYRHQSRTPAQVVRCEMVAGEVGVGHLLERPYATMSTGEQRRILLGRALVHEPEVLVLDEPTSGLDPQACFHYLSTIRSLMGKGTTMLLVTHQVHEIPPEVERVVLLKEGRVVGDGPREQMLSGEPLSLLYGTAIRVIAACGYVYAVPNG